MDSIKANMKKQKGDDLERAVKRIEEAILKYSSTLDPDKFVVENKKIVIAEGGATVLVGLGRLCGGS